MISLFTSSTTDPGFYFEIETLVCSHTISLSFSVE